GSATLNSRSAVAAKVDVGIEASTHCHHDDPGDDLGPNRQLCEIKEKRWEHKLFKPQYSQPEPCTDIDAKRSNNRNELVRYNSSEQGGEDTYCRSHQRDP